VLVTMANHCLGTDPVAFSVLVGCEEKTVKIE